MSEVKPNIVQMANTLKEGMTAADNGVLSTESDLYKKILPEDMPSETYEKALSHMKDSVAAMTLATGELGEEILKKNKKLDSVSSELKVGNHADISVGYLRSQTTTVRNPADSSQPPKDVTKHGVAIPRLRTKAQKNQGELKKVRAHLAERGEKLFS